MKHHKQKFRLKIPMKRKCKKIAEIRKSPNVIIRFLKPSDINSDIN